MAQNEREKGETNATGPKERSFEGKLGVGLLSAFLLHQTFYLFAIAYQARFANAAGYSASFQGTSSLLSWLVAWAIAAALVWWIAKPTASEFTIPFAVLTCMWFVPFWVEPTLLGWIGVTDRPEMRADSEFAHGMFCACAALTVIGITRLKLGEGCQQAATLKRMVGIPVSSFQPTPTLPQNTLLRASSLPESPRETLLRPSIGTVETAPEQLLRASQPEDQ